MARFLYPYCTLLEARVRAWLGARSASFGVLMSPKKRVCAAHGRAQRPNPTCSVRKEYFWGVNKSFYLGILTLCAEFRSVPSFGIGSSAELGMPRNKHFLPRNNGSCSESIPRNFFGTKFRSQPYSLYVRTLWINLYRLAFIITVKIINSFVKLFTTNFISFSWICLYATLEKAQFCFCL